MFRWIALAMSLSVGLSLGVLALGPTRVEAEDKKEEPKGKNLVVNGDFEEGDGDSPKGWQQIDGLTTFWENDPDGKRGKVIRIDTDIYQREGYAWWAKIATGAKAKDAPKKTPNVGDKYDTLAGNDGVWYWSDFIPVEKGKAYWLTIDVKNKPDVMAWLVGYENKESAAFGADANAFQEYLKEHKTGKPADRGRQFESFINKYTWRGQLNMRYAKPLENGWKRMTRKEQPFRPTKARPKVRFVRVLILPYWEPGICYIDNVRLIEVEDKGDS
jgi:hypothetical protein